MSQRRNNPRSGDLFSVWFPIEARHYHSAFLSALLIHLPLEKLCQGAFVAHLTLDPFKYRLIA